MTGKLQPLIIHSNAPARFQAVQPDGTALTHVDMGKPGGLSTVFRQFEAARSADVVMIIADTSLLTRFCLVSLLRPRRFRLVSVDLIHGRPKGAVQWLKARLRRALLRQVDLFIVHQNDMAGFTKVLGVAPDRTVYVPFKVNLWDQLARGELDIRDDGYFLLAGRTYRDVECFVEACRISGVPARIMGLSPEIAREHGTTLRVQSRPANLVEIPDDGTRETWLSSLARCRAIVLPLLPDVINAAGISTLFDGLAMGKPVIITESPATRGIVTDGEAALVPPADPHALAGAMNRINEDAAYRERLAKAGLAKAQQLAGEERYYRDIVQAILDTLFRERRPPLSAPKHAGHYSARPASPAE